MNNFNNNDAGMDLEFNASYDNFRSQIEFNESFVQSGKQWVFIDNGNFPNLEKKFVLRDEYSLKDFLIKAACIHCPGLSEYDAFKEFKGDFFDNCSWSDMTFDEIMEILACDVFNVSNDEVYNELEDINECLLTPNYEIINIRGFSQGDYAEIILFDEVKASFCKGFDFESMFTNLFFSSPVCGTLTIDDNEIYVDEGLDDRYQWDKAEFIKYLRRKHLQIRLSFWDKVKNFFNLKTPMFKKFLSTHDFDVIEQFIPDELDYIG